MKDLDEETTCAGHTSMSHSKNKYWILWGWRRDEDAAPVKLATGRRSAVEDADWNARVSGYLTEITKRSERPAKLDKLHAFYNVKDECTVYLNGVPVETMLTPQEQTQIRGLEALAQYLIIPPEVIDNPLLFNHWAQFERKKDEESS